MRVLLNSHQWPCTDYMHYLLTASEAQIEIHENYQKQSYRNRFRILTANGPLDLTVPIQHLQPKMLMKDVLIANDSRWQQQHWGAIRSAYGKAAYFEYFEAEFAEMYEKRFRYLAEYNQQQLSLILQLLRVNQPVLTTFSYQHIPEDIADLRDAFHPKKPRPAGSHAVPPYEQVFSDRFSFVPQLSILDMLFNCGLSTIDLLKTSG